MTSKGYKHTEEFKRKMSILQIGNKNYLLRKLGEQIESKKCIFCKKEYKGYKKRNYCSLECAYKDRSNKIRNIIEKKCIICEREFKVTPSRDVKIYCSRACAYRDKERNKKMNQEKKVQKIKIVCDSCGNKKYIPPYKWIKYNKHYCSYKCYNKIHRGSNAWTWLGGKSFEPYGLDFNKQFREVIRKRDNYSCVVCNVLEDKYKLSIHHIDYNKLSSFPQNCVSLCKSCHSKTNINRRSWCKFFQTLLAERFNYKYIEGKIILELTK